MLQRLRNRATGQEGFTLIELLVVILIIGILAAVAIPAFLNQKGKAQDANVKSDINTAQTAEETYNTSTSTGGYVAVTSGSHAALVGIEPTLTGAITNATEALTVAVPGTPVDGATTTGTAGGAAAYVVTALSPSGVTYVLVKYADGTVQRACNVPATSNASGCQTGSATTGNGTW